MRRPVLASALAAALLAFVPPVAAAPACLPVVLEDVQGVGAAFVPCVDPDAPSASMRLAALACREDVVEDCAGAGALVDTDPFGAVLCVVASEPKCVPVLP